MEDAEGSVAVDVGAQRTLVLCPAAAGRVRVGLVMAPVGKLVDVTPQPSAALHRLADTAERLGTPLSAAEASCRRALGEIARRAGSWQAPRGTDLLAWFGGAGFPFLRVAYEAGCLPLDEVPRWAVPILAEPTARAGAAAAFGPNPTRRVVAALGASIGRNPGQLVDLSRLALALIARDVAEPDQLAALLELPGPSWPLRALPSTGLIDEGRRAVRYLGAYWGHPRRGLRILADAATADDGPRLLAEITHYAAELNHHGPRQLPNRLREAHAVYRARFTVRVADARAEPPTRRAAVGGRRAAGGGAVPDGRRGGGGAVLDGRPGGGGAVLDGRPGGGAVLDGRPGVGGGRAAGAEAVPDGRRGGGVVGAGRAGWELPEAAAGAEERFGDLVVHRPVDWAGVEQLLDGARPGPAGGRGGNQADARRARGVGAPAGGRDGDGRAAADRRGDGAGERGDRRARPAREPGEIGPAYPPEAPRRAVTVNTPLRFPPDVWTIDGLSLGNSRLVLPHNVGELARWGELLHNCLGDYAPAAVGGLSIIIGVEDRGQLRYALEITPDDRRLRQFCGRANCAPSAQIRRLVLGALEAHHVM